MTVKEVCEKLGLEVFCMPSPGLEVSGAYCGDLLSWVMGRAQMGDAWLTIMSNKNVAAVAVMADLSCIILTEGVSPDPELKERAESEGIDLLGSALGTYETAVRLSGLIK